MERERKLARCHLNQQKSELCFGKGSLALFARMATCAMAQEHLPFNRDGMAFAANLNSLL